MLGHLPVVLLVLTALSPFVVSEVFADSFTVNHGEKEYDFGDIVTISGQILDFGMPVIGMSIYDPDGVILSANSLEISENTFSKSITLDPTFYEKTGEYKMKFDYAQTTQNYYFIIAGESTGPEIPVEAFEEIKITLLDSDKEQYTDGDTINILGTVSKLDSPTVLIGIYDPFGMPMGFYFGTVDSNLEFSTSFLVKAGVNFRVDGIYSIKAHYAETETIAFFNFYKDLFPEIQNDVENNIETEDQDSSSSF